MNFHRITSFVDSPESCSSQPSPSSSAGSPHSNTGSDDVSIKSFGVPICCGCGKIIYDRWMLHVGEQPFHLSCLRCCACLRTLDNQQSCYIRAHRVYCRYHYKSECKIKCAGCDESLEPSDWVRRARDQVYHLQCFQCQACKRKLSTGDTFVMNGDAVLCTEHGDTHLQIDDGDNWSVSSMDSDSRGSETSEDRGGKRARTNFDREQALYLQESFMRNPMPTSDEMEQLADAVGHTRRVVMVWFQNARARNKRMQLGASSQTAAIKPRKSGSRQHNSQPCSPASVIILE